MTRSKRPNVTLRAATLALLLSLAGLSLFACEEKKGPLEEAGSKIDEAVNDAKRDIEDAGD
jgi:hypothetical protein